MAMGDRLMKYMGSKRSMLNNGLGELLIEQCSQGDHFFDLFAGSAAVSWFVAEKTKNKVLCSDLQQYSFFLADAVIGRKKPLSEKELQLLTMWLSMASDISLSEAAKLEPCAINVDFVLKNRKSSSKSTFPFVKAYGGYYFSFHQASLLNNLMQSVDKLGTAKSVGIAAIIEAASNCAASPGHTAQPFQPHGNGLVAISEAWNKSIVDNVSKRMNEYALRHANLCGKAYTLDALKMVAKVHEGDLVFLDPPYSGVHYSRFYHVLESITRGIKGEVEGNGRYPTPDQRPQSDYSMRSRSFAAFQQLLEALSRKKARAIITFPNGESSNGLSGQQVKDLAEKYFRVKKELIKGRFSTLGGNNENRPARQASLELVLLLEPK